MKVHSKVFIKNILFAFSAQGISLILSIIMSMIVPKILGVEDFGYWQLFIFYTGYVGFFHLGFNDGVYLQYGGAQYSKINYDSLRNQIFLMTLLEIFIGCIILFLSLWVGLNVSRKFIIIATLAYMILYNLSLCLGYILQAVNLTKYYSISVIIDKIFFLFTAFFLVIYKINSFNIYIYLYMMGKLLALLYCTYHCKEIVFGKVRFTTGLIKAVFSNIRVGSSLMIANIASTLIIGSGRLIIDNLWGIETFGKISLANSIVQFILMFISQVSMVLFPMLRRFDEKAKSEIYRRIKVILALLLPIAYLLYIPFSTILNIWLPEYIDSTMYLALLIPICVFDGKMNMLCNTFMKVLRKEFILLKINILTLIISFILCSLGGYLFHNIKLIICGMVLAVIFRSLISECYLTKKLNLVTDYLWVGEILFTFIFIIVINIFDSFTAFSILIIVYAYYCMRIVKKHHSLQFLFNFS